MNMSGPGLVNAMPPRASRRLREAQLAALPGQIFREARTRRSADPPGSP